MRPPKQKQPQVNRTLPTLPSHRTCRCRCGKGVLVNVSATGTYPTDLKDLRRSDECEDSRESTGEDTYVNEFSNDDDGSDSEGDVQKLETAPFCTMLSYAM